MRILDKNDPLLTKHYSDFVEMFPNATFVVMDEEDNPRFLQKPMMRWLCDNIKLDKMWSAYGQELFTTKEFNRIFTVWI